MAESKEELTSLLIKVKEESEKAGLNLNIPKIKIMASGPIAAAAAAAAKSLQSCPTLCDPRDSSPPGSPIPGVLQARTLGCYFLLQCMKVKSESEVAQSCPTPSDPMDCSPPGSSVHRIFQARVLEWGAIAFSDPITSCQIGRETVIDFTFLGSKITADGECSHEIKIHLLFGRKVVTNWDSIL